MDDQCRNPPVNSLASNLPASHPVNLLARFQRLWGNPASELTPVEFQFFYINYSIVELIWLAQIVLYAIYDHNIVQPALTRLSVAQSTLTHHKTTLTHHPAAAI